MFVKCAGVDTAAILILYNMNMNRHDYKEDYKIIKERLCE